MDFRFRGSGASGSQRQHHYRNATSMLPDGGVGWNFDAAGRRIGPIGSLPAKSVGGVRRRSGITAPSGLFFCPPAALQKWLHIMDMRPFLRLAGGQNPGAIWLTYS
jgi:hypothetical protein